MDNTFAKIYALARQIPCGRVATYGQLATLAGNPRLSRIVGCAMSTAPGDVPCHRVVNRRGELCGAFRPMGRETHRLLLEMEGVPFTTDGRVDLKACQWCGVAAPEGSAEAEGEDKMEEHCPRCECHGHIFLDGVDFRRARDLHRYRPDTAAIRTHLAAYQTRGIRYFRDGGDPFGVSLRARELAGEYGIRYVTPAFAIHRAGRYGGIVGRGYTTLGEYRALVAQASALGADFIKLMFSGILDFAEYGTISCPPLPTEEIRELVRIAHGEGFAVMAHVNGADAIRAALEAGTDSIEHGYYMDEEDLKLLAETGAVWVPTMAAIAPFAHRPGCRPMVVERLLDEQAEALCKAAAVGALIASGSDAGAVGVPHGAGLAAEWALLEQALGPAGCAVIERGNQAVRERFCRK